MYAVPLIHNFLLFLSNQISQFKQRSEENIPALLKLMLLLPSISASSESSFSSDSSHDYCVPPENISPPEPQPDGKGYDELESIYVEVGPPETYMFIHFESLVFN